jgi:uncharacterized membrane protein YgcG
MRGSEQRRHQRPSDTAGMIASVDEVGLCRLALRNTLLTGCCFCQIVADGREPRLGEHRRSEVAGSGLVLPILDEVAASSLGAGVGPGSASGGAAGGGSSSGAAASASTTSRTGLSSR